MAYRHRPALDLVQPPRHEDLSAAHDLRDADRLEQADQGVESVGFPRRSAGSSSVCAEIHHLASVVDRGVQREPRLSWIVCRSAVARVTFSPGQMKTWTDTRAYANSPWSPLWTIPVPPLARRCSRRSTPVCQSRRLDSSCPRTSETLARRGTASPPRARSAEERSSVSASSSSAPSPRRRR